MVFIHSLAPRENARSGFNNTVGALLKVPYVIGADWFQYYDEPTHGRGDGENFNFGLVDIHDSPYDPLTRAASALDPISLKRKKWQSRLDASQGVPPAPSDPFAHFEPMLALKDWDRERGFVPPVSELPLADLYICWDKNAVYLGLYSHDIIEDAFYRDRIVPKTDRPEWAVSIPESPGAIRARIGAEAEPIINEPAVRIANLSGVNLNVRNIAAMELPAKLFHKQRLKAGDIIEFSSTLLTHCHAYRIEWRGKFQLRNTR